MAVCNESYRAVVDDNQKLQERIATQEAAIKALRDDALEKAGFIVSQYNETAKLREQQKTDLEAWCQLVMRCGLSTGHADDLQGLLREAGPALLEMSEQLARMPVCVGYVADYALHYLTVEKRVDGFSALVMPDSDVNFSHPIYIDPAPQEKQG